ncbi:hypothetical protein HN419_05900 [Candidatus Woesearchaeota archaeon]|jgi:hypothetical protein|nr:hypothetical protein [Candidatus Woesearchaeota archaeon]MBT7928719.1 hypothetical protein [Candidatus Peregrinibacteria bacterium]MBT3537596.1 hypothetical protein [Candidatus Woesearchaeota archaeon]MBT4696902.1 hypothetical protein [Candidatus Woesearchaeota archaeon]MBT4716422.1 hypothetical protein [Candidatus Woesearchaeota archaeon]
MDWNDCLSTKLAKSISFDCPLFNSLINSSEKRVSSSELLPLNSTTATSKISLYYEALREILEALSIRSGYKIYNHECYTSFLKEVLFDFDLASEFDKARRIRNKINYYGVEISINGAKEILGRLERARKQILTKYL